MTLQIIIEVKSDAQKMFHSSSWFISVCFVNNILSSICLLSGSLSDTAALPALTL